MTITFFTIIFFNLLLGIFVYSQDIHKRENRLFCTITLLSALWTWVNFYAATSLSLFWLKVTYSLGTLIMGIGLMWILELTSNNSSKNELFILKLTTVLVSVLPFLPNFINSYSLLNNNFLTGRTGWLMDLNVAYYIFYSYIMISVLYCSYRSTTDLQRKSQIKLIFCGAIITLGLSLITSYLLPLFSIFVYAGSDCFYFLIFLIFVTIAITKHNLFNIKIITAHIIVLILWVLLFIQFFTTLETNDFLVKLSAIIIIFILSILFIQNIIQNIMMREQINKLSKHIQQLNEVIDSFQKIKF